MKVTKNIVLCNNCNSLIEFDESDVGAYVFAKRETVWYSASLLPSSLFPLPAKAEQVRSLLDIHIYLDYRIICPCGLGIDVSDRNNDEQPTFGDFVRSLTFLKDKKHFSVISFSDLLYCLTDTEFNSEQVQSIINSLSNENRKDIQKELCELSKSYKRPSRYYDKIKYV